MAEFDIFRVLAQSRPNGTGNTTAFTKPVNKYSTIYSIIVCNTTGSARTYSVFICTNGTTYDETTAIIFASPIAPNETQCVQMEVTLDTTNGTIGVQSSSANALNFTIIGKNKE